MKKYLLFILLQLIAAYSTVAQQPFPSIKENYDKGDGWSGSVRMELSELFQKERTRLGPNFESELWIYLAESKIYKLYSTAFFLESKTYLHGNTPLPELAFAVRKKLFELRSEPELQNGLVNAGEAYGWMRENALLALSAEKTGRKQEALRHKQQAENFLKTWPQLRPYFPVLNVYDLCVYKSIGESDNTVQKKTRTTNR
jgi:hypothetical protein